LENEFEIAKVDAEIVAADDFIAVLNAKKLRCKRASLVGCANPLILKSVVVFFYFLLC
jgi:hypothetical protein